MDRLTRRGFVMDLGRATLGIAILGTAAAACQGREPDSEAPATTASGPRGLAWERVDLGFVSAWVVVRDGEAAIIDTGVEGSEGEIEAGLAALGLGWSAVGHVILTHRHGDHVGSTPAVAAAAPDAEIWAGAGDIDAITAPRPVAAVGDGDRVFDLDVIETPGHTPGHICLHDPVGGVLWAGDALNGTDGGITGANPQFTTDMGLAEASVRKLAKLEYQTALFGHGEPVLAGASDAVRVLAGETT